MESMEDFGEMGMDMEIDLDTLELDLEDDGQQLLQEEEVNDEEGGEEEEEEDDDDDDEEYTLRFQGEMDPLAFAEDDHTGAQPYQQFERLEYEALAARKRKKQHDQPEQMDDNAKKARQQDLFGASIDEIMEAASFGLGRKGRRKEYKKRSRRKGDGPKLSPEVTKKLGDANLLYATSRYDEAIELLKEVIRLAPNVPDAYHTLGLVYDTCHDKTKAINFYMIAAHLTPKDAYLWKRLATWSMEQGNTGQVIYCLTKAMKADPEDARVKWDRASLFVELKDYQKAAEAFDQIVASRSFDVEARKMAAKVLLSQKKNHSVNIMEPALTTNAIPLLLSGSTDIQPLLQIIDIGSITSLKIKSSHFRITLSDGTHQHKTLLPSTYSPQVASEDIQIGSVILLKKAACMVLQNSLSIRVVELEVVMRSAALTKDSSTLLHAKAGTSQVSSSSAVHTLPSVVTSPITATTTTIPFTALNPARKYWSIQGRASAKTSLKTYNNVRGSGKVFGFDLINRDKEEIHLSAFAELAESLYSVIQVGQLYIVSNGTIKEANPNYNHLKNKWEIYLSAASTINSCPIDDPTFPYHSFHFKTIAEIKSAGPNTNVDVIGVVTSTSRASTIRRKDGSETLRRTLILKDKSGFSIDVTLWGDHCDSIEQNLAEFYSFDNPPILAIKGGRVSEFNGTTIGTISTSTLIINPRVEETHQLHAWFRDTVDSSSPSLSRNYGVASKRALPRKTFHEIAGMQTSDKAIWVSVCATITALHMDDFYFLACPLDFNGKQCMKKVVEHSNNLWHCTKCNGDFPECDYRYKLKIELHDDTGHLQNVIAFNDAGNELMGITAKDLFLLSIEPTDLKEICGRILGHRFLLTLSIKADYFNGVQRLQPILINSEEI